MEYIRGDRFGHDFTSRRAKSLQRFLFRLTQHPVLRRAEILHLFLESNDWNATMNRRSARNSVTEGSGGGAGGNGGGGGGGGPGSSMFENLTDSLINAFSKVHRPNQRFIEVRDRCSQLEDNLSHVEKVVSRVARREGELEADLRDLAEQFQKLISLEPGVEDEVRTFAASVEDTAAAWKRLHDMTDQDYVGSLYDMQAYSVAFKALLKAREQKQVDHEQLVDYLSKAQADRDSLLGTSGGGGGANGNGGNGASGSGNGGGGGGLSASAFSAVSTNAASSFLRSRLESMSHGSMDPELARRERIRKLEMDVDRLTPEVSAAKRTTELFDEEVVRESGDFERIRRVEFKNQLRGLADAQIGLCDEVTAVWERYIREMDDVAPRVERQDARAS
jgi:sorting nexin-4